jgi:Sulfotransferase family
MVISDDPRFLFVHIPKTAGKSIAYALNRPKHPYCLIGTKHEGVESFAARIGEDVFRSFYSFSVVRHPLERLLSHYSYLKTKPHKVPELAGVSSIECYLELIESRDESVIRLRGVLPQNCYLKLGSVPIAVNQVLRFENLNSEFRRLCARLGLPKQELGVHNKSERQSIKEFDRVKRFVEDYYRADFELFGY